MFGSKEKGENRFFLKSEEHLPKLGTVYIIVDRETGVNYMQTWIGPSGSITPLLDANGDVIVDELS